jgi:hypothetical protein
MLRSPKLPLPWQQQVKSPWGKKVPPGARHMATVSNNKITAAVFLGTVGLDWQVSGFGDFSSRNEGDMLLRNVNTGGLMLYDNANNQITGAFFLGNVGLDWQFAGIGPIHAPGAADLVLRNGQHRRVPGLQHRQQSADRIREPGCGRLRLAARRRCSQCAGWIGLVAWRSRGRSAKGNRGSPVCEALNGGAFTKKAPFKAGPEVDRVRHSSLLPHLPAKVVEAAFRSHNSFSRHEKPRPNRKGRGSGKSSRGWKG